MAVLGDTVLYGISSADEDAVFKRWLIRGPGLGRNPKAGDVAPAVVVKVNADTTLNLRVLLDGAAEHWTPNVTTAAAGTQGSWWPKV